MIRLQEDEFLFMERFRGGDQKAFKLFYDLTVHGLAGMVRNMLNMFYIFDLSTQEDMISEAYTRLYEHKNEIKSYLHARGFLFLITKNLMVDERRRLNKDHKRTKELKYLQEEVVSEQDYTREQVLLVIKKAVEEISGDKSKEIIYLLFYENKRIQEACKILNNSPQTSRNLKTRGLNSLTEIVKNELKLKNLQI